MSTAQKIIKYVAIGLAALLILSIISGVVGLLSVLIGEDTLGEMQSYDIPDDITSLTIEVGAARLNIRQGDAFALESNHPHLQVETEGGRLTITEKQRLFSTRTAATVDLTLPAHVILHEADIETGAGQVTIEALQAGDLSLTLGAGEVTIHRLSVLEEAAIEGGAGKLTIDQSILHDLQMEMGAGAVTIGANLLGDCELNQGVGEVKLTLFGSEADYRIELEKGLGKATVAGKELSNSDVVGNGSNHVSISGGIGAITVLFEE